MITDLSVSNHRHSMALREAQLKLMMRQGGGGKGNPKGAPELWFYCVAAAAARCLDCLRYAACGRKHILALFLLL